MLCPSFHVNIEGKLGGHWKPVLVCAFFAPRDLL